MHAWPPIRSARTFFLRKVERTLGIGLRLTRASQEQERGPEALGFREPLHRRQHIPLAKVVVAEVGTWTLPPALHPSHKPEDTACRGISRSLRQESRRLALRTADLRR